MVFPYILLAISITVWALVPFRQYRGNYFIFFLILALSDPLVLLLYSIFPFHSVRFYSATSPFLIYSLLDFNKIKRKYLIFIFITITNIYFSVSASILFVKLDLLLQDLIILYLVFGKTLSDVFWNHRISIFYFILDLYIMTLIFKDIIIIINLRKGIYYFYISSALEVLIGVYFILYNERNSARYKLKSISE